MFDQEFINFQLHIKLEFLNLPFLKSSFQIEELYIQFEQQFSILNSLSVITKKAITMSTKSSSETMRKPNSQIDQTNYSSNKKLNCHSPQTYYSTNQANFFKAYAHQIQFINRLNDLINSIQKRKIAKVVEQVKMSNKAFRKYLNECRIVHIKIEDIITFQQIYQKKNSLSTGNPGLVSSNLQEIKRSLLPAITLSTNKKQNRLPNLNLTQNMLTNQKKTQSFSLRAKQMVKKGFMTLLQRLETIKKDEFTNQTKYLQSILSRECIKINQYGLDQQNLGVLKLKERGYHAKMSVIEQIWKQEKINGIYPIIMKNIREQTLALERVQKIYQTLIKS